MSDLVGNPEDRFSQNEAQLSLASAQSDQSSAYAFSQQLFVVITSSFIKELMQYTAIFTAVNSNLYSKYFSRYSFNPCREPFHYVNMGLKGVFKHEATFVLTFCQVNLVSL